MLLQQMTNSAEDSASGRDVVFAYGEVEALRQRAQALRNLAAQILTSPVMNLLALADLQTWNSPRAEACRAQLSAQIGAARQAADDLALVARRLEEQALELEYAIAQQAAIAGAVATEQHNVGPASREIR
jgi:hypothetical protein